MNGLRSVVRQLGRLFVDDGSLALAILGIVGLAALLASLLPNLSLVAGAALLFGCLAALLANVRSAAQPKRMP